MEEKEKLKTNEPAVEELAQVSGGFGGACPHGVRYDSLCNWEYCASVNCNCYSSNPERCSYFGAKS